MKSPIDKELIRLIFFYGLIGGFSALLDFGVFSLLFSVFAFNQFIANVISVHIGIATSFLLNRKYNFKKEDRIIFRAMSFYCIGLMGLGLSQLILWAGTQMPYSPLLIKFVSIFIVAAFQFALNKIITFKK